MKRSTILLYGITLHSKFSILCSGKSGYFILALIVINSWFMWNIIVIFYGQFNNIMSIDFHPLAEYILRHTK